MKTLIAGGWPQDDTLWILYIIAVALSLLGLFLWFDNDKTKSKYASQFDESAPDWINLSRLDDIKSYISLIDYFKRRLANQLGISSLATKMDIHNGDRIKITWLPDNNGEPNAYIGMEGIVIQLDDDGFILEGDTSALIVTSKIFKFIYV